MTLTGSGLRLLNAFARGRIYNFSDTTECDPGNNLRWANLTDGSECMTYDLHEEMTVMIRVLASSLPSAGGAGVSFGAQDIDFACKLASGWLTKSVKFYCFAEHSNEQW